MSVLQLGNFPFGNEEVRALNLLTYDRLLTAPDINLLHTIENKIVTGKEVGFVGKGGMVGVGSTDKCSATLRKYNIDTRRVVWEPMPWEVYFSQCFKDLKKTMAVYALRTGVDIADLRGVEYMEIVLGKLDESMRDFFWRIVWFGDKNAKHVSDGGIVSDDIDLDFLNIINGFWNQISTQVSSNKKQLISIAENAGSTYDEQVLKPENMQKYLRDLVYGANLNLRKISNAAIYCTQSFYDAYAMSLQGINLEKMYTNMVDGMQTLTSQGIPLIPMPIWDEQIQTCFNDGKKFDSPHRAIYTTKDIMGVGVDGYNSFEEMQVFYDMKDDEVYTKLRGEIDAKIMDPRLFQVAM